jgi:hypothetical protein
MTLFYSFLFLHSHTSYEKEDWGCHQKLKKINYTFQYDSEPAICQNAYYRYGGCYCKDGAYGYNEVDKKLAKKITSYYACFKQKIEREPSKVLLITYKIEEPIRVSHLSHIIHCYGLQSKQISFAYNEEQDKFVQAELLSNTNPKLKASNLISRELIEEAMSGCQLCPLWNDY